MRRKKRNLKHKSTDVIDIEKARLERKKKRVKASQKKPKVKEDAISRPESAAVSAIRRRKNTRRKLLYILIIAVLVGMVGWKAWDIHTLITEQKEVAKELKELEGERDDLKEELKIVQNPDYIEQKAREELHMIKPGETLYILKNKEALEKEKQNNEDINTNTNTETEQGTENGSVTKQAE